jgi:CheY-like chemotaxis protein
VGHGTTFWFSLPTARIEGTAHDGSWHPLRLIEGSHATSRLVVLAGAHSELAEFLQRHLRGYQVVAASDVAEATAIALESRAMAILADADCADWGDTTDGPVPIFRLPLPHPDRIAADLGVEAYLVKPVTRAKLHDIVARLDVAVRSALIVDDDPRFARLMARFLRSYPGQPHIETLLAQNGREALRLMEAAQPDLLLLDLLMRELDGRDVLAAMRTNPHLSHVPVIVISAREEKQVVLRGPLSIRKADGFHFEELLGAVEAILGVLEPPRRYLTAPLATALPR